MERWAIRLLLYSRMERPQRVWKDWASLPVMVAPPVLLYGLFSAPPPLVAVQINGRSEWAHGQNAAHQLWAMHWLGSGDGQTTSDGVV